MKELQQKSPSGLYVFELTKNKQLKDPNSNSYSNYYKVTSLDSTISEKTLRKEVWAISSGDTLYINGAQFKLGSSYHPADTIMDMLIFEHGIRNENENNNAAIAAGVAFGLVGAALVAATTSPSPKIALQRYLYLFYPETGKIQKIDNLTFELMLNRESVELLRTYQSEPSKTTEVMKEYIRQWRTLVLSKEKEQ